MRLVRGDRTRKTTQKQIKNAFPYRWTSDNPHRTLVYQCQLCDIHNPYVNELSAENHTHPTLPLIKDSEWLERHWFYINNDGTLSKNRKYCENYYRAI